MTKALDDDTMPPPGGAPKRIISSRQLPPLWERLADVPLWIDRIYGVAGEHITRDVILATRGGLLRSGVAKPILRVFATCAEAEADAEPHPPGIPVIQVITGVERSADAGAIIGRRPFMSFSYQITEIDNWETLPNVDWERGIQITDDDPPMRLPVMVFWASVADFAKDQLPQWRQPAPAPKSKKPPFDPREAKTMLEAKKSCGDWPEAPKEDVTRDYLLQTFSGVSNEPHREIRREVWPDMRRGRRHGGLAGKKR